MQSKVVCVTEKISFDVKKERNAIEEAVNASVDNTASKAYVAVFYKSAYHTLSAKTIDSLLSCKTLMIPNNNFLYKALNASNTDQIIKIKDLKKNAMQHMNDLRKICVKLHNLEIQVLKSIKKDKS